MTSMTDHDGASDATRYSLHNRETRRVAERAAEAVAGNEFEDRTRDRWHELPEGPLPGTPRHRDPHLIERLALSARRPPAG